MVAPFSVLVETALFVYGIPKQLAHMVGYLMYHNKKAAQAAVPVGLLVRLSAPLKFQVQKLNHSSKLVEQLLLFIEDMRLQHQSGLFRLLHADTTLLQQALIIPRGFLQRIGALPCVY